MKVFWKYLKQVWPLLLSSVTCIAIESLADLLQPSLLADIVDIGVKNNDMDYILRTAAIMLAIVVLTAVCGGWTQYFFQQRF